MPANEQETHPYLFSQVLDFNDRDKLAHYCKLLVGTFPIYAITSSNPVAPTGFAKRANWLLEAFMQYFYGSRRSDFYDLISSAFGAPVPINTAEVITILNNNGVLLTDVYTHSSRRDYSSSDDDLIAPTLNLMISDILQNSKNLNTIYFTSILAKKEFQAILGIIFANNIKSRDCTETIFGKIYRLIILPTKARAAYSYRYAFPLTQLELDNRNIRAPWALAYRKRYYEHYLSLPCD